jgi:uncharacterized protein (TIGR00251 family)
MAARITRRHENKPGVVLKVQVTPRASKTCITKVLDDGTVKIHLTAPPVEGKANAALKKFLAKILDIPISYISVLAGESGRHKTLYVMNMDATILKNKIQQNVG